MTNDKALLSVGIPKVLDGVEFKPLDKQVLPCHAEKLFIFGSCFLSIFKLKLETLV